MPLFDHPEKIEIVRVDDALTYQPKEVFDYAFADLHHDATDGLPLYLNLVKKELAKETDVWIEEAILTYLRRHVVALLEEEANGYDDSDYKDPKDESEKLLSRLHFHLKNVVIDSRESLDHLLSDESLRKIAKDLKA